MVEFKTWRDSYLFLKKYCRCSCVNCKHTSDLDLSIEHSDSGYARHFCTYFVSIIDLRFQTVCKHWVGENDESLAIYRDDKMWKLSDEVIDELEADSNKKWSIEEIKELIKK